jgi:predicted transcriptional regulator
MTFPLTTDDVAQSHLLDLLIAAIKWQLLRAGLEMNIFDLLLAPLTVNELAEEQGFKENETQILLDVLVSMGLLTKRLSHYQVAAKYRLFLITDDPQSMREILLHLERVRHGDVDTICSRFKNGVVKKPQLIFNNQNFGKKRSIIYVHSILVVVTMWR